MEKEFRFHPDRHWKFDFVYLDQKIALEVEGGTWGVSRHTTGSGFAGDMEKYNEAVLHGWKLLRATPAMVKSGEAAILVENLVRGR